MSNKIESVRAEDVKEVMNNTNYDTLLPSNIPILYQYLNNSYRALGQECNDFYHYHNNRLLLSIITVTNSSLENRRNIKEYNYCDNYDDFAKFLIHNGDASPMLHFLYFIVSNEKQLRQYNDYLMNAVFNNNDNDPITIADYNVYQWFSFIYTNISETNYIINCDRMIVNYIINNNLLDHYYSFFQPSQHNNYRQDIFQRFLNALPQNKNYDGYKLGIII